MDTKGMLVASYRKTTVYLREDPNCSETMYFDLYREGEGVATVTVLRSQWDSLGKKEIKFPKPHHERKRMIDRIKRTR